MKPHKIPLYVLVIAALTLSAHARQWTLQQCIDTALVHNKNLQISRNNVLLGNQKYQAAIANLIPKVTAHADYRYYTDQPYQLMPMSVFGGPPGKFKEAQFGVPHNINANMQIAIPLYNPQTYGAIQTAAVASEITVLQNRKTAEQVIVEITNLYYNLQILLHQLVFIDSNLVNTTKLLKNMQLLKEQLMAKETDVSKVLLQIEQLTTQRDIVTNKHEQVLNLLKLTLGISSDQSIQIEETIGFQNSNEYVNLPSVDIRIAETQKRLLTSELSTLKYSRLPSLSLYGSYGTTGFGYDKEPNEFLDFYPVGFVGLQLSYPFFNGTVTHRKINEKKLEINNSELQISVLSEQRAMLIENAKQHRIVALQSIETIKAQTKLAQTIYDQTVLQQNQGVANLTDVLLSDNSLRETQQAYISAVIDYLTADLELKKLSGNIPQERMEKQ